MKTDYMREFMYFFYIYTAEEPKLCTGIVCTLWCVSVCVFSFWKNKQICGNKTVGN